MTTAFDLLCAHVQSMNGSVRTFVFDGGQTVYVRIPGESRERTFTSYHGDPKSASEMALAAIRGDDIVLPPVVLRARAANLPAKELDPWGPDRLTFEDELDAWRRRTN